MAVFRLYCVKYKSNHSATIKMNGTLNFFYDKIVDLDCLVMFLSDSKILLYVGQYTMHLLKYLNPMQGIVLKNSLYC